MNADGLFGLYVGAVLGAAIGAGVVWLLWRSAEDSDRQNREIAHIRSELWKLQSASAPPVPMQG